MIRNIEDHTKKRRTRHCSCRVNDRKTETGWFSRTKKQQQRSIGFLGGKNTIMKPHETMMIILDAVKQSCAQKNIDFY
ncbi:hypothetical protein B488_07890 [Liberibacter crescens BT-1]|uniref:Uncharacterized protein n=1 Tax=Liberibacter crescens (strain BT-1) TaxID=1215343 RepID=L0EWM2_LIBCB|nr:hypothetical protein [Liberibacter crescens]AGA64781.1 hypothetical protein B488_07890 [Liberibacter crescens BT-1]AMC12846.1 hypothetical protein RL73_03985 [Liberibacter crescens]